MNSLLLSTQKEIRNNYKKPQRPVSFIISQPRAASSLFIQFLITRYKMGYPSNIISRFWDAPAFGVALHKSVALEHEGSSFSSGLLTDGPLEPHEWGWFWRQWLNLEAGEDYRQENSLVDWDGLGQTLAQMEDAFNAPLIFDNTFLIGDMENALKAFPNLICIKTTRDLFYVCNSIINARLKRHGTVNEYYGNRPRKILDILKIVNPIEQIVAQVYETEKEIEKAFNKVPFSQRLEVTYEKLITSPEKEIDKYSALLKDNGENLTPRHINFPTGFKYRTGAAVINQDHKTELCHYFEKYFGYLPNDIND